MSGMQQWGRKYAQRADALKFDEAKVDDSYSLRTVT